jgi:methylated-DNA-[protein]-cysteine S-methyltransferase
MASPRREAQPGDRGQAFAAVQPMPWGGMGVRISGDAISELIFLPDALAAVAVPGHPLAREACRQIDAYRRDADFRFDLPLLLRGTDFQREVWRAIAAVPRGRTRRYGEIAAELGSSARAVGQACGANALPLVIPCHRVVAAGGLGGFAHHRDGYLLQAKRWLLAHERQDLLQPAAGDAAEGALHG